MPSLSLFIMFTQILSVSSDDLLLDSPKVNRRHVYVEITQLLEKLSPEHRATVWELLLTYVRVYTDTHG